jgi:ribonuclease Z
MEILFLGTSSGTPTKSRNVSAVAIRSLEYKHWYLVDCGEGTQHRILHTNLSLANLAAIFITHIHGDHSYGLPGLLASAGMLNRTERLYIAGPAAVRRFIEGVLEMTQLELPYPIECIDVERTADIQLFADLQVHATSLSHRVPSFAYSFSEKTVENKLDVAKLIHDGIPSGPIWGQIQQGYNVELPGRKTVHVGDYLLPPRKRRKLIIGGDNDTPSLLTKEACTADVLVHEATYTEEILNKIGPGPQHSSAKRVAQFANEANLKNLVLTHFSPRYQEQKGAKHSLQEIEAEARTEYKGNLFLANDLDRYFLDKHGVVKKTM